MDSQSTTHRLATVAHFLRLIAATLLITSGALPRITQAQVAGGRQRDRGPGIPTSMFGTYIERGEWLLYPFLEYYRDANLEYSPDEFGFGLDADFRGRYRATEGLMFLGYGFTDRLAVEMEAAVIRARLRKAPDDPSAMPAAIEESGLGDVEGQLRFRWNRETHRAPEVFSYFETVFPLQKNRLLIGTQDWEFKFGTGFVRGFSWGTTTVRAAMEYDAADANLALGEVAVEYLRRVNSKLRIYAGVEGTQDEIEGITELQLFLRPNLVLKINNAFGLTSKATDWAPEFGLIFSIR
ncbi:MAG TPA: hypothetical protein VIK50_17550 [Gemmatimonadaceae bacterium]